MDSIMKICHELGIWDMPCKCKRPELRLTGEAVGRIWQPLVVDLYEATENQINHLKELNELYASRLGRTLYGGPIKREIEIIMEKEVWNLEGCYITNVEDNSIKIEFDRARLRY